MRPLSYRTALIIGAGTGISASLVRQLSSEQVNVAVAARNIGKLDELVKQTGARAFECDATDPSAVAELFRSVDKTIGEPDLVIYNASRRAHGPVAKIDPTEFKKAWETTAFGAFLAAQQAALRMVPKKHGAIFFTGATASVKGFPLSSAFATGKFGLRGFAQSVARELAPQGIHVAHFIIDGGVEKDALNTDPASQDLLLSPDAIAQTYVDVMKQHRSAWTHEIDLRPWKEAF